MLAVQHGGGTHWDIVGAPHEVSLWRYDVMNGGSSEKELFQNSLPRVSVSLVYYLNCSPFNDVVSTISAYIAVVSASKP
jgi:hypothetical protein